MKKNKLIDWLLAGDVSIQYQVHRDLLNCDKKQLRERISTEGWGAKPLEYIESFTRIRIFWNE